MKFKSGIEQSIYILLILDRTPQGYAITADDISNRLKLSPSYLKKMMKLLVHEGLILSSTGKKGGFSLAKPLSDINLANIFDAIEGRGAFFHETDLISNLVGEDSPTTKKCSLSIVMETIEDDWRKIMEEVTLEDLEKKIVLEYDTTKIDTWIQSVINDGT
ncbi:Rrf2 family transcriptional regulator [Pseudolactococcus yaeyamensis]